MQFDRRLLACIFAKFFLHHSLPETFHADPVDRVLTATARIHNLTLVTADRKILDYPHVNTLR